MNDLLTIEFDHNLVPDSFVYQPLSFPEFDDGKRILENQFRQPPCNIEIVETASRQNFGGDVATLAECDRLALERFQMLDALEAEDEKNPSR